MPGESKMDTPFYDEAPSNGHWLNKKKSMTLNFDLKSQKKSVLSTPDVQMLQLASPELEKFINQQGNICTTPTPTQFICPKNVTEEQSAFAQGFVEALQSLHENGTAPDGLTQNLQTVQQVDPAVTSIQQDQIPASTTITNLTCPSSTYDPVLTSATTSLPRSTAALPVYSSTSYSTSYTASPSPDHINTVHQPGWSEVSHHVDAVPVQLHRIKTEPVSLPEQPQTVPVFHAAASAQCLDLSPIDMETQERIKSERKRLRNRIAASKCRKRKLERISRLEEKVQELKSQNADLQAAATKLREQVCKLKEGVMEHVKCGCQVMLAQQLAAF